MHVFVISAGKGDDFKHCFAAVDSAKSYLKSTCPLAGWWGAWVAGPPVCSGLPLGLLQQQRWSPCCRFLPHIRPRRSAATVQHHSPVPARYRSSTIIFVSKIRLKIINVSNLTWSIEAVLIITLNLCPSPGLTPPALQALCKLVTTSEAGEQLIHKVWSCSQKCQWWKK